MPAALIIILVLVVAFFYSAVRILREYERGVVFTLGRYTGTKGPGLFLLVPPAQPRCHRLCSWRNKASNSPSLWRLGCSEATVSAIGVPEGSSRDRHSGRWPCHHADGAREPR